MSAIGPKRTSVCALHMSAFGDKADMAFANVRNKQSLIAMRYCLRWGYEGR